MKYYRMGFVWAVALAVLAISCLSSQSRDHTLVPAMRVAWPGVKADVTLGIDDAVKSDILPNPAPVTAQVALMDTGLKDGDRTKIAAVRWPALSTYGERGVAARVKNGEVSAGAADSLYERLHSFGEAWSKLVEQPATIGGN